MASSFNSSSTPSAVGARSLNSYLSPYLVHNTKLHTLLYVTILSNNTSNLPFYCASIYTCSTCETHCRPGQPSVVGGEAGMAKHAPFTAYVLVLSCVQYLRCMCSTASTAVIHQYVLGIVHRARGDLQHFRHYGNCILPQLCSYCT